MLLIILLLLWGAFLIPMLVRRIRDTRNDRSIEHFHEEHDVMGRRAVVEPVHRLDEYDGYGTYEPERAQPRRPHLTVVHDDDTYQTLEARSSWDEWSDDYEFDESPAWRRDPRTEAPSAQRPTANRYAAAYAATPRPAATRSAGVSRSASASRARSMRARRRVMFTRLVLTAVTLTIIGFFTGFALAWDLAIVAWIGVVGFIALAFYAVGQGYLHESSLGIGALSRRPAAPVEPLDARRARAPRRSEPVYDEYDEDEFEEFPPLETRPSARVNGRWHDDESDRYALG